MEEVEKKGTSDELQLVRFTLAGEDYGVDIVQVQAIERIGEITKMPKAPDFVEGVINIRGAITPVIDLRRRFDIESKEADPETRIMVIEVEDKTIGMVVDTVTDVTRISEDTVEPPPPMSMGIDTEFIKGVAKLGDRLLILLDLGKILSSEEVKDIEPVLSD